MEVTPDNSEAASFPESPRPCDGQEEDELTDEMEAEEDFLL